MYRRMVWFAVLAGLTVSFLNLGCRGQERVEREQIVQQILEHRKKKDAFFRTSARSPIPEAERAHFQGLAYYPVNLKYRYRSRLLPVEEMRIDTLPATGGDLRLAQRVGYFPIMWGKNVYRLLVYRMLDSAEEGHLFLAFTDETTGKETYPGGRYVDLVDLGNGEYLLDFNLAYNPYCAYDPTYSCPLPPPENHLPFPVRAGEKNYVKKTTGVPTGTPAAWR